MIMASVFREFSLGGRRLPVEPMIDYKGHLFAFRVAFIPCGDVTRAGDKPRMDAHSGISSCHLIPSSLFLSAGRSYTHLVFYASNEAH